MSGQRANRLPVNRRGAFQLNPRVAQVTTPSATVRAQRMEALRNQLSYPHAIVDSTLRFYLGRSGWDVNRAAQAFWEAEDDASIGLPTHAEAPAQRLGDTVEQGRIFQITDQLQHMTTAQHRRMEELRNQTGQVPARTIPPQPFNLSNSEGAVFLQERLWVLETAQRDLGRMLDAQAASERDRRSIEDRILQTVARNRVFPTGRMEEDERTALFMSITSSNGWWSSRSFLVQHNYDIVAAINAWMELGGIPLVPQPKRRRRLGIRSLYFRDGGLRSRNVNNPQRVARGEFQTFPIDQRPVALLPDDRLAIRRQARARIQRRLRDSIFQGAAGSHRGYFPGSRRGYLLDDRGRDNQPAAVNCPDPTKLRLEFMRGGILKTEFFPSKMWTAPGQGRKRALRFRWHDEEDGEEPEAAAELIEFDWSNRAHISRLNKWRANRQLKITGTGKKARSYPFNKYEIQWLTEQDAVHIEEQFYHEAGQNAFDDDQITNQRKWDRAMVKFSDFKKFPIPLSKPALQDLTERFNATFGNKRVYHKKITREFNGLKDFPSVVVKDMAKAGLVPRPLRSEAVIAQQRRRNKTSAKRYLLTLNAPKKADKEKFCDELSSDDDSDFQD